MARGVDGCEIFIDDRDRYGFLSALNRIQGQTNAVVYAYCLMGNHFHLAIKVGPVPLAAVMQRVLTSHSITFNNRHDRTGHLFQARYKSILCLDDAYLISLIRYIHMNPVRAGFVTHPEDWPWSSKNKIPALFPDLDKGIGIDDFNPWPNSDITQRPTLRLNRTEHTQPLAVIGASIAERMLLSIDEIRSASRRPIIIRAKRELSLAAVHQGYRLVEIANWLGLTDGTIAYYLRERN